MLKQFREIRHKTGIFITYCCIVPFAIIVIFCVLYFSTSFVLKHIICDDTYSMNEDFPLPSNRGVRLTAEFSINGNNEKVTKVVRNHKFWSPLNASGRHFFSTTAVSSLHHVFASGDEVFYRTSGRSLYYWNKKTDTIKRYHTDYSGCPGAEMVDVFSIRKEELVNHGDFISSSYEKYNLDWLTNNGVSALSRLKANFDAEFDNVRIYESLDVMVVPRKFWGKFTELREILDPITHERLISTTTFNAKLWATLRDNLHDMYGCNYHTGSSQVWIKSFFLNPSGIWEIDWDNDYVETFYHVKTLSHGAVASYGSDFSFSIYGTIYTPEKQHSFSVFHPESGNIFFFSTYTSYLYLPEFLN